MQGCHFIIPEPSSFPSGGNIFNQHLLEALRFEGIHISHSAFRPDVLLGSPDTLYFLDSIFFSQVTDPERQVPPHCIGLIHHLDSLYPYSDHIFEQHEQPVLRHLVGFLVTSPFTRQYLINRGYDPSRIHVIEPAPSMQRVVERPSGKVHALMLGSCIPRKGQLEFLTALAEHGPQPYYTLTIAGDLTANLQYAEQCKSVVLNSPTLTKCVRFTGAQQAESITALYARSDLFLSAAWMETYGMAIQDAVMSGLPVIVHEGGYAAEHVKHTENGFRCSDHQAMVRAFARCVEDPELFQQLSARAQGYQHPYHTWETAARLFIDAFAVN